MAAFTEALLIHYHIDYPVKWVLLIPFYRKKCKLSEPNLPEVTQLECGCVRIQTQIFLDGKAWRLSHK